jgi:uncharacterized membrane protein YagU involved in acid resistance
MTAKDYTNGIIGSLAGTLVLGVMMTMMGMMEMVAMLVGSQNVAVGWVVHVVIGVIFGVVFGFLLGRAKVNRLLVGVAWGLAAWVGGALLIMPLWLGMPAMVFNLTTPTPWWSLVGHVMYGLTAGLVAAYMEQRPELRGALAGGGKKTAL